MTVTLKFFAFLQEKLGKDQDQLDITGVTTIQQLKEKVKEQYPAIAQEIPNCMVAVDMEFKEDQELLQSPQEIALIPPVSGG